MNRAGPIGRRTRLVGMILGLSALLLAVPMTASANHANSSVYACVRTNGNVIAIVTQPWQCPWFTAAVLLNGSGSTGPAGPQGLAGPPRDWRPWQHR